MRTTMMRCRWWTRVTAMAVASQATRQQVANTAQAMTRSAVEYHHHHRLVINTGQPADVNAATHTHTCEHTGAGHSHRCESRNLLLVNPIATRNMYDS
ncbi:hypothetical protein SCLCIDRAFT_980145 [Scleroderma citrinum Foug A]|uniref:Secreted protein n=1 Tax=Scleroderma citrinum Foug A TaxID=1036808 RepID=A0A0C3DVG3_9AGAM|nr:hypothetical protein SCLCIDRAFT_980145 [Scleroderma citrinum Foug A]